MFFIKIAYSLGESAEEENEKGNVGRTQHALQLCNSLVGKKKERRRIKNGLLGLRICQ